VLVGPTEESPTESTPSERFSLLVTIIIVVIFLIIGLVGIIEIILVIVVNVIYIWRRLKDDNQPPNSNTTNAGSKAKAEKTDLYNNSNRRNYYPNSGGVIPSVAWSVREELIPYQYKRGGNRYPYYEQPRVDTRYFPLSYYGSAN